MTGSALQSDGRCSGIKERTREGFQGEGGREVAPERAAADSESSAPAKAGSPKSRNKVFMFLLVLAPFRVSFGGCFLRCFGRPLGTISLPLGSLGRSSGPPCAPWGLQGWLFSVPGYA